MLLHKFYVSNATKIKVNSIKSSSIIHTPQIHKINTDDT
jgi:hypothetical protein